MLIDPLFFTIASVCAIVYALITPLNIWLLERVPRVHSFDDRIALRDNRWAIARRWLVLLSMFFIIVAFGGIAARVYAKSPALAVFGFCSGFLFVLTELLWRSLDLFAVQRVWMAQYAHETDVATKTALRVLITSFHSGVESLYFVLMAGHTLASLLFGIAVWSGVLLDRVTSAALFVNALRLVLRLVEMHGNQRWLATFNRRVYAPAVTAIYAIIGVWLWLG
ncbi:MAG: hypothetical protein GTO18_20350 [Anaerolineales bacterium]|nr:hypothetical protein [Anaerolineales bacterium]